MTIDPSSARARADRVDQAARVQRRAADPTASVWVAASAGTGKTKVLTDRVLSLLLSGTPAERILCLTFTNAAAAEMRRRLADTLMHWAVGDDAALGAALERLRGRAPDPALLPRARRLFAAVLDAPGGMKIQTIHAFCQSLLGRFPLEAGVAPHFQLLDERSAEERLRQAQEQVLARAGSPGGESLAEAVELITGFVGEQDFVEVLAALVGERGRLLRLIGHFRGVDGLADEIAGLLGVAPEETPAAVLAESCDDAALDLMGLRLAVRALGDERAAATDRGHAARIAAWLDDGAGRAERWRDYLGVFFTADGAGPRRKTLIAKTAQQLYPGVEQILATEADRLERARDRLNAARLAAATRALLRLGAAILERFEARKHERALLDYDDLILKTRDLLRRPGVAAWVLYKLDGGLDHLLVDEAQDTSPEQWELIRALTEEFFVGEGAHEDRAPGAPRTVFAVGDAKQSIYSFQRADPRQFAVMQQHFKARADAARQPWAALALTHSFRSTAAVLQAVDTVFTSPAAQGGVVFDGRWRDHDPVRVGQAGLVELWPPADPAESEEEAPWDLPIQRDGETPPRARLARLIASRIAAWTQAEAAAPGDEAWLESRGRRVRPGDVLVLVRRRNQFVDELVRELKNRRVPVAGVDRLVLGEHIAVEDLIALGRVLLLPEDDLSLAAVLKGPLIGFDDDQLFALAHDRSGSLWSALRQRAKQDADCAEAGAVAFLAALAARADLVRPFELYADLLAQGGRRKLLARLGPDAADPIEEFLALALLYEREQVPSLEGFLHWLQAGSQEVKRDLEVGGDTVRVMTVHGAKGLQAPIVFLPDTLQTPQAAERLFWLPGDAQAPEDLPLWVPRRELDEAVARGARGAARAAQREEYRRLLYVALTRAEDRLYLCGWNTRRAAPEDCWYRLVESALGDGNADDRVAEEVQFDFAELGPRDGWNGPGLRLRRAQRAAPEAAAAGPPTGARLPLPSWVDEAAPRETHPPAPLTPSRPAEADPPVRSPRGSDGRFRRGRLIHRLLQSLPDAPAATWEAAAARFLAEAAADLDPAARREIATETLAVLRDPELAPLFGPDSRAEVPVIGAVRGQNDSEVVSGQIDRICDDGTQVLIVDFKTNRPPPARETDVAAIYLRQMAAYRAVLREIYPGRPMRCVLLWTDGPRLMLLSDDLLDTYAP